MKILISVLTMSWSLISFGADSIVPFSTALLDKGKTVYTTNCLACHGDKGDGNGPAGAMMKPKPRNLGTEAYKQGETPEKVFTTLTKGVPNTAMAPFAHLSAEDRSALTYYVLKEFKKVDFAAKADAGKKKK